MNENENIYEKNEVDENPGFVNEPKRYTRYDGYTIASLVLGIVGLFVGGIICGILAIIFSNISKKSIGETGMAKAGFVLGIIDIVVMAIVVVVMIVLIL